MGAGYKKQLMKKLFPVFFAAIVIVFFSCTKEYSLENNGNTGNNQIIGVDCRISKIVYVDTATGSGIGSLIASINSTDNATNITKFDSLSFTIEFISTPVYVNDTVYINADEYFIRDATTGVIKQLHALVDP